MRTLKNNTIDSYAVSSASFRSQHKDKGQKKRDIRSNINVIGLLIVQASSWITGITNRAIWIDDPTATEIERSILSFTDTDTAVKCSAAFPTCSSAFFHLHSSSNLLPLGDRTLFLATRRREGKGKKGDIQSEVRSIQPILSRGMDEIQQVH